MSNLTFCATFTQTGGAPATGLTLAEISLYLTTINRSTGAVAVVWNGTQNPTVEVTSTGAYARILDIDLTTYDYVFLAQYTGATVLDSNYVNGAVGQSEVTLTTAEITAAIFAGLMEGRAFEEIIKDLWAQVVGDFVADDATDPASIVYDGPDGAAQITHTLTDTTRAVS